MKHPKGMSALAADADKLTALEQESTRHMKERKPKAAYTAENKLSEARKDAEERQGKKIEEELKAQTDGTPIEKAGEIAEARMKMQAKDRLALSKMEAAADKPVLGEKIPRQTSREVIENRAKDHPAQEKANG